MPTVASRAEEHQERWNGVTADPSLRDLPYKVETNATGQIVLTPHKAEHSDLQEDIQDLLRTHASGGRQPPEYPITTSDGVKQADVVWMSAERRAEMKKTGDPPTLAPEICVEVLNPNNRWTNIEEKHRGKDRSLQGGRRRRGVGGRHRTTCSVLRRGADGGVSARSGLSEGGVAPCRGTPSTPRCVSYIYKSTRGRRSAIPNARRAMPRNAYPTMLS